MRFIEAGQQTWIVGGGAYKASDKVVQHNGCVPSSVLVLEKTPLTICFSAV
jgi:hypothetical protein